MLYKILKNVRNKFQLPPLKSNSKGEMIHRLWLIIATIANNPTNKQLYLAYKTSPELMRLKST